MRRSMGVLRGGERGKTGSLQHKPQKGNCPVVGIDQAGDRALVLLNQYLDAYLTNPENNPSDAKGRKVRKDVSAQADYYRGNIWRRLALNGNQDGWEKVLLHLDGYLDRHPEQTEYGFSSLVLRMEIFADGRGWEFPESEGAEDEGEEEDTSDEEGA